MSLGVRPRRVPLISTRVASPPWPRLSGIHECPAGQWIATVDDGEAGALICQDLDLFQGRGKGVAVVGIAGKAAHADDKALIQGRSDADLAAELAADPRLALRDAVHLGLVQGADLVAALRLLMQQV